MPAGRSASTWSFMSAISGDTTTVVPVEQQRRQLEAERLAGAGGHHGHQVAALEHCARGFALSGTEGAQAEALGRARSRAWTGTRSVRMGLDTRKSTRASGASQHESPRPGTAPRVGPGGEHDCARTLRPAD